MLQSIIILVIFVIHCHGNPITFLGQTPFQCYISSSQDTGLFLYQFYAVETSTLSATTVQYRITDGNDQGLFAIDSTSGIIRTALPLGVADHILVIQATASDGDITTASLLVHVVFAQTQSRFEHNRYSVSVAEDITVGTRFSVVRVFSDTAMVTVSIASGDPQGDLILDPTSGVLSVSRSLDHETTPSYNIILQVQDGGARNNATFVVMVTDVNDEIPSFDSSFYDVIINEGLPPGSVVTTVTATDDDEGSNGHIMYSLLGGSAKMATFEVDSSTGAIRNLITLDYEMYRQYQLTVVAVDHGNIPLSSQTSVLITLQNFDDTCPQFTSSQYEFEFSSEMLSTSIAPLIVEAFDPDNFTNIQYAVVDGNDDGVFQIDPNSGVIMLLQEDRRGYFMLNISATDLTCTTHMLVVISLANANQHRPVFNTSSCQAELKENPNNGTHVTTVVATDNDAGRFGELTYSFLVPTNLFTLNETTGVIVTNLSPSSGVYDRELVTGFELVVLATDGGGLQGFCEMWVALADVNDNRPMFVANGYNVGIATPSSIGQFVVQVSANDRDMGNYGSVMYFINDTNVPFAVHTVTGVVTISNNLANQDYRFYVTARDQGDPPLSSSIVVQVTMPTGYIPVFTDCSHNISSEMNDTMCVYTTSIQESTAGSVGITVSAISSGNLVAYQALRGSNYHSNSEGTLIVETSSGVVGVNSSAVLDYERLSPGPYYIQFLVSAQILGSSSSGRAVALVIVNVTDLDDVSPRFPGLSLFASVRENANTSSRVTMVRAIDPDSGIFGLISYSLESHNDNFAIDSSTGVVTSLRSFDAETQFNFSLIVRAVSNGRTAAASLTISIDDVNDNPPYFNQSVYNISVRETSPVLSRLYQFSVNDLDRSDRGKHVYSIAGGDNDGTFSVTRSGDLLLQQLLDYDNSVRHNYWLLVHVSDGIFSDDMMVNINIVNVDDEPPVFTPTNYSVVVSEGLARETIVVELTATDMDSDSISYQLTGLATGRLYVDDDGAIRVDNPSKLDREQFPHLQFLAFAMGGEGCIAVAMVTIQLTDVNDNPPIWLHPLVVTSLNENLPSQRSLVMVQARDPDTGRNGTVSYHLAMGEDRFIINSTTGELVVIQPIDREETPLISVMVTARDDGIPMRLSSYTEVLIEILDVNDNDPEFPYPYMFARLFEDSPIGHTLLYIPVVDLDTGTNAAIQFTLDRDNSDNCFTVNSTTGEVQLACSRDYENPAHQMSTLYISIADMGMPSRTSTTMAMLEIQLLDSNDNAPIPSVSCHQISLAENTPIGTLALTINSTDLDSGVNAEFTYSVSSGNIFFDVVTQENSGLLMLATSLDFETSNMHQLEVTVSDKGTPSLSASVSVTVDVTDVNDNPPEFSQSVYSVTVPENTPIIASLVQVVANDVDTGPGGMIDMYTIIAGNEEGYFIINETTGLVRLQDDRGVGLDHEQLNKHVLTIAATDKGSPLQLTGTASVCITVSDVDDNPSCDGHMTIVINALDGSFQAGHLGDVYLNDSDTSSMLEDCAPVSGDLNVLVVDENCSLSLQQDDPMKAEYVLVVNGTSNSVAVTTNIMLIVRHITNTDQLLEITFGVSIEEYFRLFYATLPQLLTELADVPPLDIISISSNNGYTDVVAHGGNVSSLSDVSRKLFVARDEFLLRNIPLVTIPVDACYDGFCSNLGRCVSDSYVSNSRVPTVSYNFVYYSAHVIQQGSCDCGYWATGSRCETVFDHCYSNPCQNGGTCHNDITDYKCTCLSGTRGRDCSINEADCSNRECLNGAECVLGIAASYCNCSSGYYGDNCEYAYFSESNYCTPNPCRNGATCSAGRDGFTCHCPQGYSGLLCGESVVRRGGCVSNPCYHNSSCTDIINDFVCECSVGFTGPQCRWPLNECETRPCGVGGSNCLTGRYGSYLCQCQVGYTGDDCNIASPCDLGPCENGGTCVTIANGYQCQCSSNYTGGNCETEIDECVSDLCVHNVSCRDDGIACDCPSFAAGLYCEVFCPHGNTGERCEQQIDFCQSNQSICLNGGECLSTRQGVVCDCPPTHFGDTCEQPCSDDVCRNGGTCSPTPSILGMCQCGDGFGGPQCELLTVSFMGLPQQPAYRAYDTLLFQSIGVISFRVATKASSGLLLLSTRWEGGVVMDFLSAEIIPGGHVSTKMSLGGSTAVATATSSIIKVNDGQWHNVMIRVRSKELQVLVDYCTMADDELLPLTDCHDMMETTGNYSSLDLGLPLWLGGAPEIAGLSDGSGISSCISDVIINGELLDLEDYIAEHNSVKGCAQLDGCLSNLCSEEATCVTEWEGQQCFESDPITFTGNSYIRYTLLSDTSNRKRQVGMEMAFYEDSVSISLQTTQQEGLVYWMGGATDYAALELLRGNMSYRVNVGAGETILVGGHVNDGTWHFIDVRRVGLSVTMVIDDDNVYSTSLPGNSVIFNILINEIYVGGREQSTLYNGCVDNIQLVNKQLPTKAANQFATVEFVGDMPISGCVSGSCLSNPCAQGECRAECICPNEQPCVLKSSENSISLYVYVAIGAGGLTLLLFVCLTAVILCCCCCGKRGKYIPGKADHHEMYFADEIGTIGIDQEDGGGEQDIPYKDLVICNEAVAKRPSTPEIVNIITSCKPELDKELVEVDSLRHFAYEGSDHGEGSMSSICSDDGRLLERLGNMGAPFDTLVGLLEHLEQDSDNDSET